MTEDKTEAVLVSIRKLKGVLRFHAGQHVLKPKPFNKYLDIILHHRLTFKEHLTCASKQGKLYYSCSSSVDAEYWWTQTTNEVVADQIALIHSVVHSVSLDEGP